ncbi:MAG: hypothetical protein CALGDGBN_00473 [Pseudomonadales bacterium]|nr:hypothetical protein [Pseudomonadales bacterium]
MPVFYDGVRTLFFFHVPKCGGTTVESALRNSGYKMSYFDGGGGRDSVNRVLRCSPQHWQGSLVRAAFKTQCFNLLFMIVRDPLARIKSEFLMRNRGRSHEELTDPLFFSLWLDDAFSRYKKNPFAYDNHLRPQVDFYIHENVIYKFEMGFHSIFEDLSERIDCKVNYDGMRLLESKKNFGISSDEVNVSSYDEGRIRLFYQEDYKLFGY